MSLLLPALLLLAPASRAAGLSADIELLRPTFSPGGPVGLDTPWVEEAGVIRGGVLATYTRDPLILLDRDGERGTVVGQRLTTTLGLSADLGAGASARLVLPAGFQWGSEVPELAADGPLLGDLRAGLRFAPPTKGPLRAGLRADLAAPTGSRDTWSGERTPRIHGGLLLGAELGALALTAEAGVEARSALDTGRELSFGTEGVGGLGLSLEVWPERAALTTGLLARAPLSSTDLATAGGALPAELLTGMQLFPGGPLQVDLGAGKGLTAGYGTSELRLLAGLTWVRRPPPPPPPRLRVIQVAELEDEGGPPPPPPPPDDSWDRDQLVRLEDEARRIEIREPLQFRLGTAELLPESLPTLREVARLLGDEWRVGHVVIEGHASDEGSFTYNYELSIQRARAVWEALLQAGVHPDRISYRGLGEVFPVEEGSRADNRRVEFRIVWLRDPGDEGDLAEDAAAPLRPDPIRLPWTGEPTEVIFPAAPGAPEEEPPAEAPPAEAPPAEEPPAEEPQP